MKIGDKVSLIDDNLKGKIIAISHFMIEIEDEHGFNHSIHKEKVIPVMDDFYDRIKVVVKEEPKKNTSKKHNKEAFVIDLHFDALVKDAKKYDATERLFTQKEKLISDLDFCRKHRIKRVKIIHGIGDGFLQRIVHDVVSGLPNVEYDEHHFFLHQSGSLDLIFL